MNPRTEIQQKKGKNHYEELFCALLRYAVQRYGEEDDVLATKGEEKSLKVGEKVNEPLCLHFAG